MVIWSVELTRDSTDSKLILSFEQPIDIYQLAILMETEYIGWELSQMFATNDSLT